ncbi:hypothetical protein TA3x_004614 [Tundrisphaera sp. TA3]|uniref:hypothetical protein n=1 Tax=Tundrisphaera sp. TA3 TaxID=3435775 RepID=UPI003EBD78DA
MKRLLLVFAFPLLLNATSDAGWPLHPRRESQVPPRWAEPGLQSPAALTPPSYGRRPWAYALAQSDTPSAKMARFSQLGGGIGPTPGASNEPGWYPGFLPGVPWAPNPVHIGR